MATVAHLIGEELNAARWYGDVQQELKKEKRHVFTPPPWMKDGYRMFWVKLFARTKFMMKAQSGMKWIKSRFLIHIL